MGDWFWQSMGPGTQLSRRTAVQQQCMAIIPVGYGKRDLILQAEYLSINQKRFNLTLSSIPCIWISVVVQRFISSEDVCWNIRNVKLNLFPSQKCIIYYNYFLMFITACLLFLPLQTHTFAYPPPPLFSPNTTAHTDIILGISGLVAVSPAKV